MRNAKEIFSDLLSHQIKGLMIHSQLADYYRFLGLDKYAECHESHYKQESKSWRKLAKYYTEHYGMLADEQAIENPAIIPSDWYGVKSENVDANTKRRAVERGLKKWIEWETETKKMYEQAFSELLSLNEGASAMRIKKYMCDVDNELAMAGRYLLNKQAVNYDIGYIVGEQEK